MTRAACLLLATLTTLAGSVVPLRAQARPEDATRPTPLADASAAPRPDRVQAVDAKRACDGCPRRSVRKSLWQATAINGVYEVANLVRGQVTAHITPKTWWANMQNGWVWDLDDFVVNQIGHPYQGSNYFNAGRANGLSFYESAAVAAFGSATWEYFGETNMPSLNDLLNTTLGGIALGEMFHRTGWLIRNTHATGRDRLWSEIGGTVFDPVTGLNRFLTGDAARVTDKPSDMMPSSLSAMAAAGVLWRGSETRAVNATGQPFLELDGVYGDPTTGRSRMPFDAFGVRLRFGGGSAFSEARVRGRLLGQPFRRGKLQFSAVQSYDFQANDAYHFGAQSFEGTLGFTTKLSSRLSLWTLSWGGVTVLGAVDSIPLDAPDETPPESNESAGQGISEGPRFYDYGPGGNFGATVAMARDGRAFALFAYEGRHLYSLDGVRANHFLQRVRGDVLIPLRGALGIGLSGEYFDRRTYYQDPARTKKTYHYPQVRAYFTWSIS